MPVRIYAFAKELGLDNKQLLDYCEQAGIKGKGSALASLDDDEIATIKTFIEGDSANGAATKKKEEDVTTAAPTRESVLPAKKTSFVDLDRHARENAPAPEPEVEEVPTEVLEEVVAETAEPAPAPAADVEVVAEAADTAAADVTPATSPLTAALNKPKTQPKPEAAEPAKPTLPKRKPIDPNAPIQPAPLDLSKRNQNKQQQQKKPKKKKQGLNFKIAAMPAVAQPSMKQTEPTEKVQKPDIALPQDAIAKARSGAAPLEQFTGPNDKKKKGRTPDGQDAPLSSAVRRGGRTKREGESPGVGGIRQNRQRRPRNFGRDNPGRHRRNRSRRGPVANTAAPRKDDVVLQLPCTIKEFSEAAGVSAGKVLMAVKQMGAEGIRSINVGLGDDYVELLLEHFDVTSVEIRQAESLEEQVLAQFETEDNPENLIARPPIITFLGHVDHGKTSLLDALIGINVVSGEAGGITQHIRAYEIMKGEQKIAFVDTPGHEAFTEMRARGANVTDIAVLVVAADDGVMPQTEEAISHARAAEVPIIVALNKIDVPGAQPDKALQDLATHGLLPSEWGGDIEVIKTSATQGTGLDELLETVLVTAELQEYKADPTRAAYGTCLEAEQQAGKGVVAKMMVQNGTLKVGDVIVCGSAHGKVKAMYNTLHPRQKMEEAGPSTPINLTGLDVAPGAGDKFYVLDDITQAREIAADREHASRTQSLAGITTKVTFEGVQERLALSGGSLADPNRDVITLNLIIRADVKGSIEAIQKELGKIDHPEVRIKILQALVGGITVADIRLAQASDAVIVGFNVVPDESARGMADDLNVEIRKYDVIYKITDDVRATLEGRLKPEEQILEMGMAMVMQTFSISKTGTIAGCRVMRGNIARECRIKVIRDSRVIGDYPIDTLKRVKDDAKEVSRGMECGIKLAGFNDVKEGDTLEAYKIEEVARTL